MKPLVLCSSLRQAEGLHSGPGRGFALPGSDLVLSRAQTGNMPLLFIRGLDLLKAARCIIHEHLLWKSQTSFPGLHSMEQISIEHGNGVERLV